MVNLRALKHNFLAFTSFNSTMTAQNNNLTSSQNGENAPAKIQRLQLMLDTMPLCCTFFNTDGVIVDCNLATLSLFELSTKEELIENFESLSPIFQPDGEPSADKIIATRNSALKNGTAHFDWMHQTLEGIPLPCKVTLVRAALSSTEQGLFAYVFDQRATLANEAKIHAAAERMRIMLDATPLCCNFWDKNYNNIDCNLEAAKLFELSGKQEYLERFFDLSPEYQPEGMKSADKALAMLSKAFAEGKNSFEWLHQKLNGEKIPCEITLIRIDSPNEESVVIGYTRDLREIKAKEALLQNLTDNIPVAVYQSYALETPPYLSYRFISPVIEDITGVSAVEILESAVALFSLVHPEDLERAKVLIAERATDRKTSAAIEFRMTHKKTGKEMWLRSESQVQAYENGRKLWSGYFSDITEIKANAHELTLAKQKAEMASRSKSEFLANMSHEIRTPMNGVLGMIDLALDTPLDEEQQDYLQTAKSSAESLLTIINDILDLSKIEAGKLQFEHVNFRLEKAVTDATKILKIRTEAKGLQLHCNIAPEVPEFVISDPVRLRQVIMNLIGNAVKFTAKGSISLAVTLEEKSDKNALVHFAITDTGIGIAPDKLGTIFEAFSQEDSSITRKFGGTGLGLTISTLLVKALGGKMWVESTQNVGSTFHFTARFEIGSGEVYV